MNNQIIVHRIWQQSLTLLFIRYGTLFHQAETKEHNQAHPNVIRMRITPSQG